MIYLRIGQARPGTSAGWQVSELRRLTLACIIEPEFCSSPYCPRDHFSALRSVRRVPRSPFSHCLTSPHLGSLSVHLIFLAEKHPPQVHIPLQPLQSLVTMATDSHTTPAQEPLFSADLISPAVVAALPDGYTCKPLQLSHYSEGYLDVLRVLTTVGDISEEAFTERFNFFKKRNDEYFILCIIDGTGKVVGTGSLVAERKL